MMQLFDDLEAKQYFTDGDGMLWIHGTLLCQFLGFSKPSEAILMHTDDDERCQVDTGKMGKKPWFVSEPGVWGLIMQAKTTEAKTFKRKLKHEILPAIRAKGGYISPDATHEQITALQNELAIAEKRASVMSEVAHKLESKLNSKENRQAQRKESHAATVDRLCDQINTIQSELVITKSELQDALSDLARYKSSAPKR